METICTQCQIPFSEKNIITLSSAEIAQGVIKFKAPDKFDFSKTYVQTKMAIGTEIIRQEKPD